MTRMDIFVAKADCKWYDGERILPLCLDQISQEQIAEILESFDEYPKFNRRFINNLDLVVVEPREVALDKDGIKEEITPVGNIRKFFEGELFLIIKVPSFIKMDSEEVLENMNLLLNVGSEESSTKLIVIKYIGTNT